jgi:hypothetical protein
MQVVKIGSRVNVYKRSSSIIEPYHTIPGASGIFMGIVPGRFEGDEDYVVNYNGVHEKHSRHAVVLVQMPNMAAATPSIKPQLLEEV